jgi:hypothetical protein
VFRASAQWPRWPPFSTHEHRFNIPIARQQEHFMPPIGPTERDLRLDLFRGLALWLIFVDHIPSNIVNWITIRNYGFSDAAEIFVFISGYTAAFVYGRAMQERGLIVSGARILRRAWQVYVAHVFIFVIFMAEVSYLTASLENPLYSEEMRVFDFLQQPGEALIQALMLKFQPNFMDVLPLYIVLLLAFPLVLGLLLLQPTVALIVSVTLYSAVQYFSWNLPAYPTGSWFFNPLAWQLIFVVGAWCSVGAPQRVRELAGSRLVVGTAIAFLAIAFLVVMTWYFPRYAVLIPKRVQDWMYPIDKNNMDLLRFLHFMALAIVTVRFIPIDWPGLKSPWLRPMILCGQHSLEIFCLGIFLSFIGHFVTSEVSRSVGMQILISVLGISVMVAVAWLITWYNNVEGRGSGKRPKSPQADLAGGEA